ncbi:MAG: hypothetical protein ACI9U2_002780 [Bradymonadia bacterium]|jgi:hypothetical protein
MRHLFFSLACAAPLTGCILSTEQCGRGLTETQTGRCLPQDAPPPYYSDAGFDLGIDAVVEPEPIPEPIPQPGEPEPTDPEPPEPETIFDPWEGRDMLLIVDRSDRDSARSSPGSPGYDLDAIVLVGVDGELVGQLGDWETAQINDPFGRNISQDPGAAIGEPDADGARDSGRFVSLGTEGGFAFYQLDLVAPVATGVRLFAFESDLDGSNESAEIYLCFAGRLDLSLCRAAGTVDGTDDITLRP